MRHVYFILKLSRKKIDKYELNNFFSHSVLPRNSRDISASHNTCCHATLLFACLSTMLNYLDDGEQIDSVKV